MGRGNRAGGVERFAGSSDEGIGRKAREGWEGGCGQEICVERSEDGVMIDLSSVG